MRACVRAYQLPQGPGDGDLDMHSVELDETGSDWETVRAWLDARGNVAAREMQGGLDHRR